jgi:hypothetical protein
MSLFNTEFYVILRIKFEATENTSLKISLQLLIVSKTPLFETIFEHF